MREDGEDAKSSKHVFVVEVLWYFNNAPSKKRRHKMSSSWLESEEERKNREYKEGYQKGKKDGSEMYGTLLSGFNGVFFSEEYTKGYEEAVKDSNRDD
jgi:flagellar biosynthesis/type III secretory pathway protein FliH